MNDNREQEIEALRSDLMVCLEACRKIAGKVLGHHCHDVGAHDVAHIAMQVLSSEPLPLRDIRTRIDAAVAAGVKEFLLTRREAIDFKCALMRDIDVYGPMSTVDHPKPEPDGCLGYYKDMRLVAVGYGNE